MRCCGQRVGTPFCPNCGKKAAGIHPLDSLLIFCRKTSVQQATKAATWLRNGEDREKVGLAEAAAVRWRKWAEQLEQLIEEQSISSPEKQP